MAVQAPFPYPSNAFDIIGQHQILNGEGAVRLSNPNSDLTCTNAKGTKKRNRYVSDAAVNQQLQFPIASKIPKRSSVVTIPGNKPGISTSCTSGSSKLHPSSQQRVAEINATIRLHNDQLISGLDELRKRHYAELLRLSENQAAKRIAEKDAELEILTRKQSGLESTMKQIAAESQVWFTAARRSEAQAFNLRASLGRVLLRQSAGGECNVASAPADDAQSCCYEGDGEDRSKRGRGTCRACRETGVSVLLLPCRHLCLCSECEPATDTCPICYAAKNVGLHVFF